MKKFSLILAVLVVTLAGCGSSQESDKIQIMTTVYPLELMAGEIGGDNVDVSGVYPAGADLHTYEPTSRDLAAMAESDIVFYVSDEEETFVNSVAVDDTDTLYINVSQDVKFKNVIGDEYYTDGLINDPHFWLSPKKDMVALDVILTAITNIDSENKDLYQANHDDLYNRLSTVDRAYTEFADTQENPIIVAHDAYGYLESDYGIEYYALYGESHDEEPSSSFIAQLIDLINTNGIKYIYSEQNDEHNEVIEQIASETNSTIEVLNNMSTKVSGSDSTLDELLLSNLDKMGLSQ